MSRVPKFRVGEDVVFHTKAGRNFRATVTSLVAPRGKIQITISGDPFPTVVNIAQVHRQGEKMPTGSSIRQLAKEARMLGVEGYSKMGAEELARAVAAHKAGKKAPAKSVAPSKPAKATRSPQKASKRAPAKKATTKPTRARTTAKKAVKKAPASTNGNPFRFGCNNHKITEELIRGGRRTDMVKRLKRSMKVHPWSKPKEEDPDKAIDKRILLAAGILEKDYGFQVTRDGRGPSGTIKAFPPGAKASGQKKAARASSKPRRKATSR